MPKPAYVIEENLLRKNLRLIKEVAAESGAEIILAFKAFANWKTFPIFREYVEHTTASSPYEARLAFEKFGTKAHAYSPAYEDNTFDTFLECCDYITFNSLSQYERFLPRVKTCGSKISLGVRINPEYSEIETDLYNPCAPGTRFGIEAADMPEKLPENITGFHVHNHCENDSYAFERSLQHVEAKFSKWFDQISWINFGGGHLMTRKDYDTAHLVKTLRTFRQKYPNLKIIMEPGSAFAWQTGYLRAYVVDIVENKGVKTAILNVSFTCHMPDCLEMPYFPAVRNAQHFDEIPENLSLYIYRIGGNSCLSGDFMSYWGFKKPLQVGDEIIFEDMIHYTTVKTNMFNGIDHPDLVLKNSDGTETLLRRYEFEDYLNRMD
ncbi:MAG: carboxynorspermidine decarboxylase [Bacteroidaceae bacterium]|nr:carboxynorspermidine decarboxylase [Bacteroidaceae bacterium]